MRAGGGRAEWRFAVCSAAEGPWIRIEYPGAIKERNENAKEKVVLSERCKKLILDIILEYDFYSRGLEAALLVVQWNGIVHSEGCEKLIFRRKEK